MQMYNAKWEIKVYVYVCACVYMCVCECVYVCVCVCWVVPGFELKLHTC
jgi:hypothetical protein